MLQKITQKLLHHLFTYDPQTGHLIWKNMTAKQGKSHIGEKLGFDREYRKAMLYRKSYSAHRLIWLFHYGSFPEGEIDHINHNRLDNRIENLRDVSHSENSRNVKIRADNSSGQVGVNLHKGYWDARISHNGRRIHIGSFKIKEDAISARKQAEIKYHYHDNHGF